MAAPVSRSLSPQQPRVFTQFERELVLIGLHVFLVAAVAMKSSERPTTSLEERNIQVKNRQLAGVFVLFGMGILRVVNRNPIQLFSDHTSNDSRELAKVGRLAITTGTIGSVCIHGLDMMTPSYLNERRFTRDTLQICQLITIAGVGILQMADDADSAEPQAQPLRPPQVRAKLEVITESSKGSRG